MGSLAGRLLLVSGVLLALLGPVVLAVLLGDGWLAAGAAETGGEVALLVALLSRGHGWASRSHPASNSASATSCSSVAALCMY